MSETRRLEALRTQWEYSHATTAALTFIAFCAAVASTLTDPGGDRSERLARRRETAGAG